MEVAATSGFATNSEVEQLRTRLAELEQTAARRARELTALHEIALEIGQLTDLTTLLQTIVKKAASLLNAHMGGLYLVHPESQTLELVVAHNLPGIVTGTILNMGEGLSGRIAQTGQVQTVPDYQAWPGQAAVYAGAPFRRVVGVPLKVNDKVIGVINITDDQQTGDFAEDEVRLVTLFAEQAATAVEKARLLAGVQRDLAERRRAEQVQSSLYRITEAVHTTQNLDELYRSIHGIIADLMPARNFYIALYDEVTDLINFPYLVDELDDSSPVQRPGKGLTAYVLRTGRPLFAPPEVFEEMVRRGDVELIGGPSIDWLGVPLKVQDKSIGVVVVQTYSTNVRLTEEHKDILVFVSSQIAMAIQRKGAEEALRSSERRFRDLLDAAQRQTQELALLDRVRTALTRELDLTAIFRTIVTAIAESFGYTLVSLYMLEGDTLVLQHQTGYEFIIDRIPTKSGITGRVARTGRPVLLEDVQTDPACLLAMDDIVSEVCVPLLDQGKVVGVLNVESTQGVNLSAADLRLMTALSEHISIAISRARLYTEARESAARLRTAIENLPFDFFALDKAGRYVLQNSTSVRHWGDRLGRRVSEVQVDPAIASYWEQKDRRAFAGGIVESDAEYTFGDEKRYFHEISGPIRDGDQIQGILGVNIDVTDRRRAEEQLRASEARLRAVIANIPVILLAFDQTGRFTFIEGRGLEALGGLSGDFIGRSVFEFARDLPRVTEAIHLALGGEAPHMVVEMYQRVFEVWLSPLASPQGELNGVIGVAVDVTEREHTEEALRRAQKMESLGLLAGGIAHDFNNLLVAILGQTSLALSLLSGDSPARAPIEKAVTASRRAADLTRQLLAYSGRGQFEHRVIKLNELIQENLHLFEVAVPKTVTLRSDLAAALPLIMGDAGQLKQVIMNLIINAAEAIGDQVGLVVVRTRRQNLTAAETVRWQIGDEPPLPGDYVLLIVQDNGQGMDAETLSRVFDPFFSTKFTGRGLGLAAVLGIVRGHSGGLKVASEPNAGTTFEIILPVALVNSEEPTMPAALQEAGLTQQFVLVIDDEQAVRDAVTDILELEGMAVMVAPDGRTGIDLYRQRQAEIGLILLDLSMPGLNGEETFRELRQTNAHAQVLLSSGYSRDEVAARFAGQNDVGFIQKPYDVEQLLREVKRYLPPPPAG